MKLKSWTNKFLFDGEDSPNKACRYIDRILEAPGVNYVVVYQDKFWLTPRGCAWLTNEDFGQNRQRDELQVKFWKYVKETSAFRTQIEFDSWQLLDSFEIEQINLEDFIEIYNLNLIDKINGQFQFHRKSGVNHYFDENDPIAKACPFCPHYFQNVKQILKGLPRLQRKDPIIVLNKKRRIDLC
jgi:hypothetical protein